ncbi:MAG: DUF4332 domain-containing protein [Candidatus Bathyarchaeota archaeon]|nr:DUF4332 domain-containing protein [Candidatus Bathyarchaeota archaeon]
MDEEAFRKFLKRGGRSQGATKRAIVQVTEFERYLREERDCRNIDRASPADLEAFVSHIEEKRKGAAKLYLWGIRYFYDHTADEKMCSLAGKLRQQLVKQKPFLLKDFRGINPAYVDKLKVLGIRSSNEMLEAGRTHKDREELSAKTGIGAETLLELVKLSDPARIRGVKSTRARLYFDAGVDTVEKMAKWDPEKLRTMLIDFVEKTGFDGIAPLPKEAEFSVAEAKRLPRIVEY